MDAVMARMMGLAPGRLRFLQRAVADGLGRFEAEAIEIVGEMPVLTDFKVPPRGGEALAGNKAVQDMMTGRVGLRPQADAQRCTGCGTCVDQCPAGALTLVDDLPRVAPELCISCFCCQEMCPEQAMMLV
jgi:heterodisulfide reductase subunit A-like polyferredoxin